MFVFRVYKDIDDDESKSYLVGDSALALAVVPGVAFVSGSGTNCVNSYSLDSGDSNGLVTRFTADVTCLDAHDIHLASGRYGHKIT